jgi:glycosyltransferase involved in cell wall biosynthesis
MDGGSTDGTIEYLDRQEDVNLIQHGKLIGCVNAYNDGFSRAKGKYVAFLNDDIEMQDRALFMACEGLDRLPEVGLVSIPYYNPGDSRPQVPYCTAGTPPRRWLFASFGVVRRELGEKAEWFDGFSHYNGDCHLAMSVYKEGYSVAPLWGHTIYHHNLDNAVRGEKRWISPNTNTKRDSYLWHQKWGLWQYPIEQDSTDT